MFKKSLASIVSAAILVAGPGHLTLNAAAQTIGRGAAANVSVIPTIGTGLNSPAPGASSFNIPTLTPGALIAPALLVAPSIAPAPVAAVVAAAAKPLALAATPVLPAASKVSPLNVKGSPLSVIASRDAKVGTVEKGAALNALFENSLITGHEAIEVLGQSAAFVESGLSRFEAVSAKSPASIEQAKKDKGATGGAALGMAPEGYVLEGLVLGLALAMISPVAALVIMAMTGLVSMLDGRSAKRNIEHSMKFFGVSIGAGVSALIILVAAGFGVPFYFAAGAAALALALGKIHASIYDRQTASGDDRG